jgi:hypothetical protein
MRATGAKIVVVSPHARGGKISNVPWLRRNLSWWANRFLSRTARGNLSTLTSMVRAYDGRFLRTLNLKSMGMEVNAEIIYKAMLLRARIEEIPAHLDWWFQTEKEGARLRQSSMRLFRHTNATLLAGFLFRPVLFFLLPGLITLVFALFCDAWIVVHFLENFPATPSDAMLLDRASLAVAMAYQKFPHTFVVGGLASMLSIQLISLGILALQSKAYFEELFHFVTTVYRSIRD